MVKETGHGTGHEVGRYKDFNDFCIGTFISTVREVDNREWKGQTNLYRNSVGMTRAPVA